MFRLAWVGLLWALVSPVWAASFVPSDTYELRIYRANGEVETLPMTLPSGEAVTLVVTHRMPSPAHLAQAANRPEADPRWPGVLRTLTAHLERDHELLWLEIVQKDPRGMNTVAPVDDTDGLGVDLPHSEERRMTRTLPLAVGQTARWVMPGGPNDERRVVTLTRLKAAEPTPADVSLP